MIVAILSLWLFVVVMIVVCVHTGDVRLPRSWRKSGKSLLTLARSLWAKLLDLPRGLVLSLSLSALALTGYGIAQAYLHRPPSAAEIAEQQHRDLQELQRQLAAQRREFDRDHGEYGPVGPPGPSGDPGHPGTSPFTKPRLGDR